MLNDSSRCKVTKTHKILSSIRPMWTLNMYSHGIAQQSVNTNSLKSLKQLNVNTLLMLQQYIGRSSDTHANSRTHAHTLARFAMIMTIWQRPRKCYLHYLSRKGIWVREEEELTYFGTRAFIMSHTYPTIRLDVACQLSVWLTFTEEHAFVTSMQASGM